MPAPTFNLGKMQGSTDWTVDPKTQTVAGQLESVIKSDSPLMQQARARAMEAKNKSGLMNSSMAMGAADSAVYDTAMSIAAPDANTYSNSAQTNAATKNLFANNQNQYTQQGTMAEYAANANEWGAQQDFGRTTSRDATQQGYTQDNMNLGSKIDLNKMAVNQGYTQDNMTLGNTLDLGKMAVSQGYNKDNAAAQQGYNVTNAATQQGYTAANRAADQANTVKNLGIQNTNDLSKITAQGTIATDVANIEAGYKSLTQGSVSATNIVTGMQTALNSLMNNTSINNDLPFPDQPPSATNMGARDRMSLEIKNNARDALDMIGALAGDTNMSTYVNGVFGSTPKAPPPKAPAPPPPPPSSAPPPSLASMAPVAPPSDAPVTPAAPSSPTYLGPEGVKSVVEQATEIANEQGITPERALYDYARGNNMSYEALDITMGWPAGRTKEWALANGLSAF